MMQQQQAGVTGEGYRAMMTVQKDRYGWIKTALADAGLMQKDVAKAWKCDVAVISRWIKSGEPKLSFDRAGVLAKMLDMPIEEFQARLAGGTPPRPGAIARAVAARELRAVPEAPTEGTVLGGVAQGGVVGAVKEMGEAAARAQAMLPPGLKVVFSIEKE